MYRTRTLLFIITYLYLLCSLRMHPNVMIPFTLSQCGHWRMVGCQWRHYLDFIGLLKTQEMSQTSPEGIASAGIDCLSPLMTRRVCPLLVLKTSRSEIALYPIHRYTNWLLIHALPSITTHVRRERDTKRREEVREETESQSSLP